MRYQKIESAIWHDEKFVTLSPMQQRLFLYLLTCPHGNILGLFVLKEGYACDDLGCSRRKFRTDLSKLCEIRALAYDQKTNILWILNFLEHNPITNPNQVKSAVKTFSELPKSYLLEKYRQAMKGLCPTLYEGLTEGLGEGLPHTDSDSYTDSDSQGLGEGLPKPDSDISPLQQIFTLWNSLEIVRHKTFTPDMRKAVKKALKNYDHRQIEQAVNAYGAVLRSGDTFWKYRWGLIEFCQRGIKKFLDMTPEQAVENFKDKKHNGEGRKPGKRLPKFKPRERGP